MTEDNVDKVACDCVPREGSVFLIRFAASTITRAIVSRHDEKAKRNGEDLCPQCDSIKRRV